VKYKILIAVFLFLNSTLVKATGLISESDTSYGQACNLYHQLRYQQAAVLFLDIKNKIDLTSDPLFYCQVANQYAEALFWQDKILGY